MRVDVVDPPAFTRPYDHALCTALARAGADVRLVTSPFAYGDVRRNPSQCHGLAGNGELFVELYRLTGDARWRHRAG